MKKRGRRIILEKKRDKRGSRSLGAYAGHVSVVYQQKTLPVVFRFELFRRKIGIPCVILYCPDTGYIYIEREGLIMRNTYSQTQSCDTRNAGGIRGFLQADN